MQRNPQIPFTYQYFQPEAYHFSIDSIELPWEVAQILKQEKKDLSEFRVLDLCAGCGVVGLELQFHVPELKWIDFVEVQKVYQDFFEKNRELVCSNKNLKFLNINYDQMQVQEFYQKYDLIISNPPYFFLGEGRLSTNEFKNRCRFFIDSTFEKFVQSILYVLKPGGSAFILIRQSADHGRNLVRDLTDLTQEAARIKKRSVIRGTHLVEIQKNYQFSQGSKS